MKVSSYGCYFTGNNACAFVELPQLPLLLLVELQVHTSCAGAAATVVVVCHRVPFDADCCCGLLHLIPVFFFFV